VEFVRVEQDEDEGDFEVRAYPFQWIESEDDVFYTLAERETHEAAHAVFQEVIGALSTGAAVLDLRPSP
jgi:hypothetical protein